jgi:hypothetical protein
MKSMDTINDRHPMPIEGLHTTLVLDLRSFGKLDTMQTRNAFP